jgi:hypothetical protein
MLCPISTGLRLAIEKQLTNVKGGASLKTRRGMNRRAVKSRGTNYKIRDKER